MTTKETTGFYVCVSIHEAASDAPGFTPVYEERLTLIQASTKEEATRKAEEKVKGAVHTYTNSDGQAVTWRCRRIVSVSETVDDTLADGAELHGRYFRDLAVYERFESDLKARP